MELTNQNDSNNIYSKAFCERLIDIMTRSSYDKKLI